MVGTSMKSYSNSYFEREFSVGGDGEGDTSGDEAVPLPKSERFESFRFRLFEHVVPDVEHTYVVGMPRGRESSSFQARRFWQGWN